jgi:4-amino-4-deoxy-L-arabinose transferase-like glycosyltransferase
MSRIRFSPALVAISLGAFGVRLAWILLGDWSPERQIGDAEFYHRVANALANGDGFVSPEHPGEPTALYPPLHPLTLSLPSLLGLTSWTAHRLAGALVGSLAVAMIGLLGRRVGGERTGLVAAGLAAAYPVLIRIDGAILSEPLYGVLVTAVLLTAYRLLDRPGAVVAAGLGALIGLAALARAEALLLLPLLVLPMGWRAGGRRLLHIGLACVALLLVLAPWSVRNAAEFDRLVLVSNNSGTALAGANCPEAYAGRDLGGWQFFCLRPRRRGENEAEHAARLRERALDYARDHAGRLPVVVPVRALRTWSLYQPFSRAAESEGGHVTLYRIGVIAFFALALAAIAGAVLLRRRGQTLMILLAPLVLVTLSSMLVNGLPRYRFAAEPALLVLAAVALVHVAERRRR